MNHTGAPEVVPVAVRFSALDRPTTMLAAAPRAAGLRVTRERIGLDRERTQAPQFEMSNNK